MKKHLRSLLAGIALSVPAFTLSAQSIRDSVELEPVVVTASHSPKALKDAPVVTRLITLHDIKIADATNIQDLLTQEIPGLEFGLAMSQETSLNMSGFGGNAVLFLVDGERMAGETMDNVDYNRLNLDNVGRIEIVKGADGSDKAYTVSDLTALFSDKTVVVTYTLKYGKMPFPFTGSFTGTRK